MAQYPGDAAQAGDLLRLAESYEQSARLLLRKPCQPRHPDAIAPGRLCAVHAVELYLNAYLRASGEEMAAIRGLQHDLALRIARARHHGLVVRKRTEAHLAALTSGREYILARYAPGEMERPSPINRIEATLSEIGNKVRKRVLA
jgi:hypothetical protein